MERSEMRVRVLRAVCTTRKGYSMDFALARLAACEERKKDFVVRISREYCRVIPGIAARSSTCWIREGEACRVIPGISRALARLELASA